jgi:hypothetical protein
VNCSTRASRDAGDRPRDRIDRRRLCRIAATGLVANLLGAPFPGAADRRAADPADDGDLRRSTVVLRDGWILLSRDLA